MRPIITNQLSTRRTKTNLMTILNVSCNTWRHWSGSSRISEKKLHFLTFRRNLNVFKMYLQHLKTSTINLFKRQFFIFNNLQWLFYATLHTLKKEQDATESISFRVLILETLRLQFILHPKPLKVICHPKTRERGWICSTPSVQLH